MVMSTNLELRDRDCDGAKRSEGGWEGTHDVERVTGGEVGVGEASVFFCWRMEVKEWHAFCLFMWVM
jgi:hypothetical protein